MTAAERDDSDSDVPVVKPKSKSTKRPTAAERRRESVAASVTPTAAARRVFQGVALPETPSFDLVSAADGSIVTFTGIPALPGITALELLVDGVSIDTLPQLFTTILGADGYEQFKEFASDPDNGITLDVLTQLAQYLVGAYTGRPTGESNDS